MIPEPQDLDAVLAIAARVDVWRATTCGVVDRIGFFYGLSWLEASADGLDLAIVSDSRGFPRSYALVVMHERQPLAVWNAPDARIQQRYRWGLVSCIASPLQRVFEQRPDLAIAAYARISDRVDRLYELFGDWQPLRPLRATLVR